MRLFSLAKHQAGLNELDKICIFSHFDKNNRVAGYVKHYVQVIENAGFSVVFVSTSDSIHSEDLRELLEICVIVCQRSNTGYDFGSYKTGIDLIFSKNLNPSQLLLVNDSVYGPFREIHELLEFGKNSDVDIWGCTDSYQHAYHLQSYFLGFNKKVIESNAFKAFWKDESVFEQSGAEAKFKIIEKCELKLTQYFIRHGFRAEAAYSFQRIFHTLSEFLTKEMSSLKKEQPNLERVNINSLNTAEFNLYSNPSHQYWNILNINLGCPLLKRELLLKNPTKRNLDEVIYWINSTNTVASTHMAKHLTELGMHGLLYQIDPKLYVENNPTNPGVETSHIKDGKYLTFGIPQKLTYSFDEDEYLRFYPDVNANIMARGFLSGYEHFKKKGLSEGRIFFTQQHDERALSNALIRANAEISEVSQALVDLRKENQELLKKTQDMQLFINQIQSSRAFKTLSRIERIKSNFR